MRVLVVNAGSTSVKLRLLEAEDSVTASEDLGPPDGGLSRAIREFLGGVAPPDAVGHRIVHGGPSFTRPVLVDAPVRSRLGRLSELAPLHNPPALAALDGLAEQLPGVPQVACFDTSFHADMPEAAWRYAVPDHWVERWNIRRFGFHGLSCQWASQRAGQLLGPGRDRLVVCHLGGGASVTAVRAGRSVDTTMGFTPTEGLVMATRPGDVDPGALAWLFSRGVTAAQMTDDLEHRSGLLALSGGVTADMRSILGRRAGGDPAAARAVSVYVHRLRAKVAAMSAAVGGPDCLVFTAGVGEGSPEVRSETCASLGWMGVELDEAANRAAAGGEGRSDRDIATAGSPVRILVIEAREDLVVAASCRQLLGGSGV